MTLVNENARVDEITMALTGAAGGRYPPSCSVDAEPCPVSLIALFQHRYPYLRHYTGFFYRISLYLYDYFTCR